MLERFIKRKLLKRDVVPRHWNKDIAPDEIFLDSKNLPQFDQNQFEGRIEKPIRPLTFLFFAGTVILILMVLLGKSWMLQVAEGEELRERSEKNRLRYSLIFADRGIIYDRKGEKLAWNVPGEDEASFAYRTYAELPGLAHVLGYVNYPAKDTYGVYYQTELIGKDGVEAVYNKELAGENGLQIVEMDARSNIHSAGTVRRPTDGSSINLSIDAALQSRLHEAIKKLSSDAGFAGGAGVMMDLKTGEIIALTSYPEYNSSVLSKGDDKDAIEGYRANTRQPFLNRVVAGLYTPGSIVKPFVAIGALQEKIISPTKQILSTGSISLPNPYFPDQKSVFKDWKAHGYVDMRRAIAVSSDVYFYEVGGGYQDQKGLGITKIKEYMELFGFATTTGIALSSEKAGVIPDPQWKAKMFPDDPTWRVGNTYHTSIGQYGFQVTPIQVVRAVAALGNGGKLITPTLLKVATGTEATIVDTIDLPAAYFQIAREGMRMSVTEGTAKGLLLPEIAVAAKTGTAELGVSKDFVNSWSVGFFPYEKPRYAFAIMMERGPRQNLVGATSVMRAMLEWMWANRREYVN